MSIAPIQAVTIECVEDEERAFRRIGRAVVFLWQEIPPETRERVLEQAIFMSTGSLDDEMSSSAQFIEHVIEKFAPRIEEEK